MHVRRCRDMLCEDTGRVLPFAAQSAVTAQAAPNETLWVRREDGGLVALEATGSARVVFDGRVGPFYVARDGTAFVRTAASTIVHVRADATTLGETQAPIDFDALYATSAGDLWINAASANTTASLRP